MLVFPSKKAEIYFVVSGSASMWKLINLRVDFKSSGLLLVLILVLNQIWLPNRHCQGKSKAWKQAFLLAEKKNCTISFLKRKYLKELLQKLVARTHNNTIIQSCLSMEPYQKSSASNLKWNTTRNKNNVMQTSEICGQTRQ